jgi:hypothetical protein
MLMSMKAQVEAMRALSVLAARSLDISIRHPEREERMKHQAVIDLLTPVVKGWCTEQGIEIASLGIQVHGGMGFVEETGAAQHLRDARIATIYEGTTGIQANDLIGRKLAAEKGMTAKAVIAEIRAFDRELAGASSHPALGVIRRNLAEGVSALAEATDWLLETTPTTRRLPLRVRALSSCGDGGRRLADGSRSAHRQAPPRRRRRRHDLPRQAGDGAPSPSTARLRMPTAGDRARSASVLALDEAAFRTLRLNRRDAEAQRTRGK